MRVFESLEAVPAGFGPSAVTIGKFDGVHLGHREVLGRLTAIARERGLHAVAITFDRHPLAYFDPATCPPELVSNRQKLELLATTGLDATVVLPFDASLVSVSAEDYARSILVGALGAKVVLVGADFRFGSGNTGDVPLLVELGERFGFEVEVIEDVAPVGGRRVSSTWIRELLDAGAVENAAELLGHLPTVSGLVVHGYARGRDLGFPTANLAIDAEGRIPADGVYAGWLTDAGVRYPAAISVGDNPTFEGVRKTVEAYVIDRELDLYDHLVDVEFAHRIRGQVAYQGVEPLIAQITWDVERVKELLLASS
ncbi:bifunctional riboflavin kinase/FAD synthetase [Agromyces seonyuensis]|uniref:Riboflavin biosynthesis protein n=1 Tax=Agromyces seonyuensis TaxID=2662446 RepID=A0A6I4NZL3_9MICO|nr:bifunctional riboflavin kinase/FAD synthetase [Agromyces seonyuensis]